MANIASNQPGSLAARQLLLIESNVRPLRQALLLLEQIDDRSYSEPPLGFEPHRVGGHLRHILEFYECFLDGLHSGHIDYSARKRNRAVEASRTAAIQRIQWVVERLEDNPELRGDSIIWIRIEECGDFRGDSYLTSSPARELQMLAGHTIHHFALIAMTLTAHGIVVDPAFGMAPSTLRYQAALPQRRQHSPAEAA